VINALTVDVEEWFHICGVPGLEPARWDALPTRVESTTRTLLDMCDRAGVRATFFVLGWVAARYPRLVAEIRAAGHEVGSHGYWHRRAYELGEQRFAEDLALSLDALAAAGAHGVNAFRAPEWSINQRSLWALPALARHGIRTDASMAPVKIVGSVTFPREPHVRRTSEGEVLEVPPLVVDRIGQAMPLGWGWGLRMSSPRRVLAAIARTNQAGRPAVLTVHPWEIDPSPPRIALPAGLRFAHYFRLAGFAGRLQSILEGASFGTLDASVAHLRPR
jgi:polysaccharide deacetylase family protein (PEP-CTERM system associated)